MQIKRLETRVRYLCNTDGHEYVRELVLIGDDSDRILWWLNKDHVEGETYKTHEELEVEFNKANVKRNGDEDELEVS